MAYYPQSREELLKLYNQLNVGSAPLISQGISSAGQTVGNSLLQSRVPKEQSTGVVLLDAIGIQRKGLYTALGVVVGIALIIIVLNNVVRKELK